MGTRVEGEMDGKRGEREEGREKERERYRK